MEGGDHGPEVMTDQTPRRRLETVAGGTKYKEKHTRLKKTIEVKFRRVTSKKSTRVRYRKIVRKGRQYMRRPDEYWRDLTEKARMAKYEEEEIMKLERGTKRKRKKG